MLYKKRYTYMSTIIIQAFQTIKLFFLNKHVLFQARRCLIFTNKCIRETLFMCRSQVRLLLSVFPSFCLLYAITFIIFVFVFIIRKVVGFLLFCHDGGFSPNIGSLQVFYHILLYFLFSFFFEGPTSN